ncbi:hypothetical protein V8C44DRAFT_319123 [Trichoderma aethiopicum]
MRPWSILACSVHTFSLVLPTDATPTIVLHLVAGHAGSGMLYRASPARRCPSWWIKARPLPGGLRGEQDSTAVYCFRHAASS